MARRTAGVSRIEEGLYRVRTSLRDPKTGRRVEIDRLVRAEDVRAAQQILATLREERLSSRSVARARHDERLNAVLETWLESKRKAIRPSTHARYTVEVRAWTVVLGDYYASRVAPEDVRETLAGWQEGGLGVETINGRLRTLRLAAKETKHTLWTEGVKVLAPDVEETESAESEGRGLDIDELRALLAAGPTAVREADGTVPSWWPRAWALVATMAWTGLRFGEASALRWSDIDIDSRTLRVRRAQWRGVIGHPKARASRRAIPIDELVATLREHRASMLRDQQAGVESELVFPSRRRGRKGSELVSNTYARKTMIAACKAAEIDLGDRPALHCLRHTMANLVRRHATEEVRRSIIGHEDEVETYTHVVPEEQRVAMGRVFALVRGGCCDRRG